MLRAYSCGRKACGHGPAEDSGARGRGGGHCLWLRPRRAGRAAFARAAAGRGRACCVSALRQQQGGRHGAGGPVGEQAQTSAPGQVTAGGTPAQTCRGQLRRADGRDPMPGSADAGIGQDIGAAVASNGPGKGGKKKTPRPVGGKKKAARPN